MEKRVVQDIVPSGRTIRDISPVHSPRLKKKKEIRLERGDEPKARAPRKKSKVIGMLATFAVIFLGIAVIAVAFSLLFSKAVVTVTPKITEMSVNGTYTAKKVNPAETFPSGLSYDVISASDSQSQPVSASDGPLIQSKAKGTVILYNEQAVPQKIVAGTRISNSDGLIYRTTATVTISPGKSGSPGNITVGIVADQAGQSYNMSQNDASDVFKVVAYKGSSKYSSVYAKLKTSITGGFSGNKKIVTTEVEKAVSQSLKNSLKSTLISEIKTLVPKGSILYDNAYSIGYDELEPVSKDKDTADITIKGTVYAIVFNKDLLVKFIAKKELDKFPPAGYDVKGIESLNFSLINSKDFSYKKSSPLIFSLKGPATIIGTFSPEALKNDLKGTYLKDSNNIFSRYPTIANAYVLVTPFWMRSFPNSTDKIIIETKKPI